MIYLIKITLKIINMLQVKQWKKCLDLMVMALCNVSQNFNEV
jgi:hypothetical protein